MEQDPNQGGNYNKDYLQRVYQSLLKTGNNISLAELNTAQPAETFTDPVEVANQSQIRQTVKIIQSNGAAVEAAGAQQARFLLFFFFFFN